MISRPPQLAASLQLGDVADALALQGIAQRSARRHHLDVDASDLHLHPAAGTGHEHVGARAAVGVFGDNEGTVVDGLVGREGTQRCRAQLPQRALDLGRAHRLSLGQVAGLDAPRVLVVFRLHLLVGRRGVGDLGGLHHDGQGVGQLGDDGVDEGALVDGRRWGRGLCAHQHRVLARRGPSKAGGATVHQGTRDAPMQLPAYSCPLQLRRGDDA